MKECLYFNPMYMQSKCNVCGAITECICANCSGEICKKCHDVRVSKYLSIKNKLKRLLGFK